MPIIDLLLPEFDQEMANTRKMLERVPTDKLGWKPHTKCFTLGGLASHVANMVDWTTDTMTKDSFDVSPPGAPPYKPPTANSTEELLAMFDKSVASARAALAVATDQQFMQPWSLLGGGKVFFTMPRIACIRSFVLNHTIHHRAQLGMYLRLLDVPVPGMYGPSADDPNPFKG
jgi:uncharacterized damage-inducible protein DinB